MPIVVVDNLVVYSGPSAQDAKIVYDICRTNMPVYGSIRIDIKVAGSLEPRGIFGESIAELEGQAKEDTIKEAIAAFKSSMPRRSCSAWNNNPSPVPPKVVVKNLLANSVADDFEKAQTEWEYNGELIFEGENEFSHECGLCGPKDLMKTNHIIRNTRNGNALRVGSVCVKRFLILSGASTIEESADLFDRRTLLAHYGRKQGYLIADLARDRVSEKSLILIMETFKETFPNGISSEDADIIIREAGVAAEAGNIFKGIALGDISVLRSLSGKMKKMRDRPEGWQKKLFRVASTLSNSSAYKNG